MYAMLYFISEWHSMASVVVGRSLLSVAEVHGGYDYLFPVLLGAVAVVTIIVVMGLCVCKDKPKAQEDVGSFNQMGTPPQERTMQMTVETTDVAMDMEASIMRHSANGSVGKDSDSRPKYSVIHYHVLASRKFRLLKSCDLMSILVLNVNT